MKHRHPHIVDYVESSPRRDWRLAAASATCISLGLACLLLAACSGSPTRTAPSAPPPEAPPLPLPLPPPQPPQVASPAPSAAASDPLAGHVASPWQRLRNRYAMPGCNYSPAVQRFAKAMASSPRHLTAALHQAMPYLLVATAQIEKYDMPGEFAFLPWVESSYTMIPPNGDGVAGMWQLMPLTARESGLRINADYDGRLDVYASSQTALVLLKQYQEEFGDWRLANMAFNAGVNSVRQALASQGGTASAKSGHLYLNQTTDEHLTKLLAMSCIVSSPARFGVVLPEPEPDDIPTLVTLPAPIDLRLAAQIADIDYTQMQRWNPAYLKGRMPDGGPYNLLVPAPRRAALERTLGMLPQYAWRDWRDMKLQQEQKLDTLAMAYDLDPQALATINHVDVDVTLLAGKRLLLPGRDNSTIAALAVPASPAATVAADADQTCTVRAGDTLWDIARRYRLRVDDLVQWNRLPHNATLRLGQHLVLAAPH